MNTANILEPHTIAAQAPTTRAAELYPLVLTPRILNSRGISARHIRAMVAAGTLQRIQRGAYIYTRDAQALTPDERLAVRCIAAYLMGLQGVFSHTSAAALWGLDVLNTPSIRTLLSILYVRAFVNLQGH
ncbi:type IV toxin-antitoxin system AbiEi family antitoxin domain-containing protein, partial [uncultured Rothia sp.]|uniref:type IV toxin-antitoxin system AbiEi family antitoxin domain-containing protein n=1 Tax=uncultured Rothia sp. TaxID=316088 RepID=UPI002603896E